MKLSLLTTVSLYLFASHLIFATNGLGLRPQSSMKRLRRLLSPQPRYPLLLPPIRGHQESRDANKTPSFGGGNGGGNGGGRTRKRGHRTMSPRKRTRPSLKKSLHQQQQQQQQQQDPQNHPQKNVNENRLPYEHILRARYRDYEDRERRNQKLRLLAEENEKKKKKKALLQKESESLHSQYHHGNYPNPNRQTYQDSSQPALTQDDDDDLTYPEFDPYAVPAPPRGQNMVPLSQGPRYQFQPQPVLPEPMPFTDSSEADTYPNAPERDDDPYPYQEREPQSSKGFSPPRGFQAEAFNPGYQPTGFKDKAPGHFSLNPPTSSTNAKRKHFNIHRHNQKPNSYNVKNRFQGGGGYEESSPLPAVPSSLIGHRPDMNKQALVTEAPESALRWVDSKFIHNQHGTFTNQVLTEFVNTLNQVQEKARSLGDMNRAEVQLNPNGRNHFSPLNDWSNYHKQFTFLVNDNVDAEMPIDHEEAGQSYRRSDQSHDYDYEDKPVASRQSSPKARPVEITARSDPGYERNHYEEKEVEPFSSDPLPPPGNPVYDGYNKIDQLYRSNYWD